MKIIPKRRRLEKKTNYSKRRKLLENSEARIVIRKTNKYIILQYVESKAAQDKIKYTVNSKDLIKQGWPENKKGSLKSLAASYLAGLLMGKTLSSDKEVKKAVIDTGLIRSTKGSKIYAAVKGIIDGGYEVSQNKEMFPEEERIKSDNVKDFFDKVKSKITS